MSGFRIIAACVGLALAAPASGQEGAAAGPPASTAAESRTRIAAGTVIDLVTTNTISSKKSVKGDLLYLKVAAPLTVDGLTVIPVGTVVVAQLTRADPRGAFGKSGTLDVQLLYAELPGGTVRVSGALEARGKGGADDAAATAAAFLVLPFIKTGRSAEIPAGSEVSARLDRDLWIERR